MDSGKVAEGAKESDGGWKEITSKAEAEDHAKNVLGIKDVDYGKIEVKSMNAMNQAVWNMYQQDPSTNGLVTAIKVKAMGALAEVKKLTGNQHIFLADEGYFKKTGPGSPFDLSMKHCLKTKFHPVGADTPKAIFDHEMGHILCAKYQTSKADEIFHLYKELTPQEKVDHLSGYSKKTRHEFVAEAWAEYKNNPNPRPIAKLVGQYLEDQIAGKRPVASSPHTKAESDIAAGKAKAKQWYGETLKQIRGGS